jgi:hypothetical protein
MVEKYQQRGSVLLYAILMMSVFLAIGMSLISLFVGKLKIAGQMRSAVSALYVADSAAELCLFEARSGQNKDPISWGVGTSYQLIAPCLGWEHLPFAHSVRSEVPVARSTLPSRKLHSLHDSEAATICY